MNLILENKIIKLNKNILNHYNNLFLKNDKFFIIIIIINIK